MRNSWTFEPDGFGQALPSVTLEFLGRVNWAIVSLALLFRRHARAWPGHPRLGSAQDEKTWMAGPSPAMHDGLSINPRLRLDVLHVVRHRVGVHRTVVDR